MNMCRLFDTGVDEDGGRRVLVGWRANEVEEKALRVAPSFNGETCFGAMANSSRGMEINRRTHAAGMYKMVETSAFGVVVLAAEDIRIEGQGMRELLVEYDQHEFCLFDAERIIAISEKEFQKRILGM